MWFHMMTYMALSNLLNPILDAKGRSLFESKRYADLARYLAPSYPTAAKAVLMFAK